MQLVMHVCFPFNSWLLSLADGVNPMLTFSSSYGICGLSVQAVTGESGGICVYPHTLSFAVGRIILRTVSPFDPSKPAGSDWSIQAKGCLATIHL